MTVTGSANILETQLFYQRDARDPLGIWGARGAVTGDASGGHVFFSIQLPADKRGGRVYACYGLTQSLAAGGSISTTTFLVARLLTNWPNIDVTPGVQGFATLKAARIANTPSNADPTMAVFDQLLGPTDRFLLLFDPRSQGGAINLIEMWLDLNVLANVYTFEAYGYYWDRDIMEVPGGPRHPGSD